MYDLPENGHIIAKEYLNAFVFAGRALFTVERPKDHFTFKVRAGYQPHIYFVRARIEHTYEYLGMLRHGVFRHDLRGSVAPEEPRVRAAYWFFEHLRTNTLPDDTDVYHHGVCGRCARKLTVPESIESGLGPICSGRE